jgi:hypothetical protein
MDAPAEGGMPVAANWQQWAQGGYMPPVGQPSDASSNAVAPQTPAATGTLSGTQTPPTMADYARNPYQSVKDWMALQAATGNSGNAFGGPPAAPPQAPAAPPVAAAPTAVAQSAPEGASTAPSDAPLPTPPIPPSATLAAAQAASAPAGGRDYSGIYDKVVGPESGNDQSKTNPLSGAAGAAQFLPSTFADFIKSPANTGSWTPADIRNPDAQRAATAWLGSQTDAAFQSQLKRPATDAELTAGHFFGPAGAAALAANPTANSYDVLRQVEPNTVDAVFANNKSLIRPTMSAGDALQLAITHFTGGKPGAGTMVAGPGAPTGSATPAQAAPDQSGLLGGIPPFQMPYDKSQMQMPGGTKLLALAAGLLSGRSFGQGLGQGLANLTNVQAQDLANKREINSQGLQAYNANLMNLYRSQMAGNSTIRTEQQGNSPLGQPVVSKDAQGNEIVVQPLKNGQMMPLPGLTPSLLRTALANDTGHQATLTAAKTGAAAEAKDTQQDVDQMLEAGQNTQLNNQRITALQSLVPSAGTGPGLLAAKRQIATYFGVDIGNTNPDSAGLAQTIMSQTRGGGFMGKNMRTQREFNTIMEGLVNMDQRPEVLTSVVNGLQNLNGFQQHAYNDWLGLPQDQQKAMRGDQDKYQTWLRSETNDWAAQMDKNGGMYGTGSQPGASAAPATSAPTNRSYKGVGWTFTPGQ